MSRADTHLRYVVEFYKAKQVRRGGLVESFVDAIAISPAEGKLALGSLPSELLSQN